MAPRVLRYALIAAAAWYIGAYLTIAILRLNHPFDLEWMEGGSVDHVARLLQGQPLYVAPQIAFIPYEYPPLYFYVSALVAKVIGIGYTPLRLVSLAASAFVLVAVFRLVICETGDSIAGVAAVGLFAATFRIGGAWLDLARVDTLLLAFVLVGLITLRRASTVADAVFAGTWFALAALTKQPALALVLPVALHSVYAHPRHGVALAATIVVVTGAATALLQTMSGGWYTFYVWRFPFEHAPLSGAWRTFWTIDMAARLPIVVPTAVVVSLPFVLGRRAADLFWPAASIGALAAACRARLQTGGYDNVLLPAYLLVSIAVGISLGWIAQHRSRWLNVAYLVVIVQMALLFYDPRPQVPRAADRAAGERLVAELAAVEGDVLVPYHGNLSRAAGKPIHAHLMQVFDILKLGDKRSAALASDFRTAIRNRAFGAIVLDDRTAYFFKADVDAAYVLKETLFTDPDVLYPVTGGMMTRPQYLYVPRAGPPPVRRW